MKDYFYDTISQCFGNAIYTRFGSVSVTLYTDGNDKEIRYVAYDIPNSELETLSEEKQNEHIQLDKNFDISDVDFNDKMSVLQKINDLVTSFEMEVYKD